MINRSKYRSPEKIYGERNLQIVIGITLMAILGSSSIGPVLPTMADALSIPHEQIGLVITAFVIPIAIGTPISGVLADRFGPRRIIATVVCFWSVFTALTAAARGLVTMLVVRFLFGVGDHGTEFNHLEWTALDVVATTIPAVTTQHGNA